ncbi:MULTISPECIES: DUF6882 domain-containing protein [unclassified Kribbella]|uniref:DUF6882 domain-containing protein n=1 Tax=unclassified Kribbella TaxID=2644121 RepID=UPI0030162F33
MPAQARPGDGFGPLDCHDPADGARPQCLGARRTGRHDPGRRASSWLWSWANDSLPPAAIGDMPKVRQYGEAHGYPVLPWPGFDNHSGLVKEARVVSAAVLDAAALWTDQSGDVEVHFLLHDLSGS